MRARLPKWVYASLGLNILTVGFIVGGVFMRPPLPLPMMDIAIVMARMPEHGRAILKETFAGLRALHEIKRDGMLAARKGLADAIAAPELDMAVLDRAENVMRENALAMMKEGSEKMRAMLQRLTPEERALIAEHLRKAPADFPPMPPH